MSPSVAAESAARDQVAAKNRALEQLADNMRLDLKYAEMTAKDAPDQLAKLGWGPRGDPRNVEPPGVVRAPGIKSQGDPRSSFASPTFPKQSNPKCHQRPTPHALQLPSLWNPEHLTRLSPATPLRRRDSCRRSSDAQSWNTLQ